MNTKFFDEFAKRFGELPPGIQKMKGDFELYFKQELQKALAKLNLVTREEFETQTETLARVQQKLELLEVRIQALENSLDSDIEL